MFLVVIGVEELVPIIMDAIEVPMVIDVNDVETAMLGLNQLVEY